jgi:hypothetical protein
VEVFEVMANWTAYLGAAIILTTILLLTFLRDKDIISIFKRLLQLLQGSHPASKPDLEKAAMGDETLVRTSRGQVNVKTREVSDEILVRTSGDPAFGGDHANVERTVIKETLVGIFGGHTNVDKGALMHETLLVRTFGNHAFVEKGAVINETLSRTFGDHGNMQKREEIEETLQTRTF